MLQNYIVNQHKEIFKYQLIERKIVFMLFGNKDNKNIDKY